MWLDFLRVPTKSSTFLCSTTDKRSFCGSFAVSMPFLVGLLILLRDYLSTSAQVSDIEFQVPQSWSLDGY